MSAEATCCDLTVLCCSVANPQGCYQCLHLPLSDEIICPCLPLQLASDPKYAEVDRKPPRHCLSFTGFNFNGDVRVFGGACSFGLAVCESSGVTTSSQEVQSLLTVQSLLAGQLLLVCMCSSCALPHQQVSAARLYAGAETV